MNGLRRRPSTPLTVGGMVLASPWATAAVAGLLFGLAVLAIVAEDILLTVDEQVGTVIVSARTARLDVLARVVTQLGGGPVVIPVAIVAAAATFPRSPPLAVAILIAVATRYGVEWLAKEVITRARPTLDPLTEPGGFSFPSGHALGATVGWGIVPAAVVTRTGSRALWRAAMAASLLVAVLVAGSRVYLGVHWLTDVVASLLLGFLILGSVDIAAGRGARWS